MPKHDTQFLFRMDKCDTAESEGHDSIADGVPDVDKLPGVREKQNLRKGKNHAEDKKTRPDQRISSQNFTLVPTEQGAQQQVGSSPGEGVGRNIGIPKNVQVDQAGKFPAKQHHDRRKDEKRKHEKWQTTSQIQEPQKHQGVKQGLNEPEAFAGLKGPDAEHDKVEEHTLCQDASDPVNALQSEDQDIQTKIEKRKNKKEDSR